MRIIQYFFAKKYCIILITSYVKKHWVTCFLQWFRVVSLSRGFCCWATCFFHHSRKQNTEHPKPPALGTVCTNSHLFWDNARQGSSKNHAFQKTESCAHFFTFMAMQRDGNGAFETIYESPFNPLINQSSFNPLKTTHEQT
jgi:hypothetical protein